MTRHLDERAISGWLAAEWQTSNVVICSAALLSGGAIQQNWRLLVDVTDGPRKGSHDLVLRLDAPSAVPMSHGRAAEFQLIAAVAAAGVTVPEPLALCTDSGVIGRPFFVMRRAPGQAEARALTSGAPQDGLAFALGTELARLHRIVPPRGDLAFLTPPPADGARSRVTELRSQLDRLASRQPALEWGLNWLWNNAPPPVQAVLCHRDFRTGNYLVEAGRISAVLDWEFACWSDPAEDLGWLTAACWRFERPDLVCGGIGSLEDLLSGYATEGAVPPDAARLRYWQVMATARWAVIALLQAERHRSGTERSLELALTGCLVPELALELLIQTR